MPHLSYIGDTTMGSGVNVGAGSITCNYDGVHKHKTVIGKDAFIGSDTMMVAPAQIGDGALVAAGSVITEPVPADALGLGRARQVNIEGWAADYRRRLHELVGPYDESLPVVGDWEFNLRAAAVTEILLVDVPLAYWSLRPQADGAEANSVQRQAEHARFDASVRARAIRDDLQSGGRPGPYLYQAHLMADLERRVIDGHDLTRESLDLLRSLGECLERIEARQAVMDARQRELEARLTTDRSRGRGALRALRSAVRSLAHRARSASPRGEGR